MKSASSVLTVLITISSIMMSYSQEVYSAKGAELEKRKEQIIQTRSRMLLMVILREKDEFGKDKKYSRFKEATEDYDKEIKNIQKNVQQHYDSHFKAKFKKDEITHLQKILDDPVFLKYEEFSKTFFDFKDPYFIKLKKYYVEKKKK